MGREVVGLPLRAMIALFGAAAVFEHLRLGRLLRSAVNEDVALMWLTSREWGRLRVHQPNIYGQAYGWSPEALPMEALRWIGLPPWDATPLVLALIAVLGWFALAAAAWRRSHRMTALVAVLAPSLLGAYYAFYVTAVPTYQGPHLLTIAGAALLIARPRRAVAEWGAWTFLGLGLAMDPSAALIGAPVAMAHLLVEGPMRRRLALLGAGTVLPLAYVTWSQLFYRAHPDHSIFGSSSVRPDWGALMDNIQRPGRYFELTSPQLAPFWPVLLVVLAVLVGMIVTTHRWRHVVPAVIVPLLLVWGLATPKATGEFGPFMPPGRIFATLPHALWFLLLLAADSGTLEALRQRRRARLAVVGALVGLAGLSVAVRAVDFDDQVSSRLDRALVFGTEELGYGFTDTQLLIDRCRALERAARTVDDRLLLFAEDRTSAYGCAALSFGRLDTLVAERERRTWRLYEELERTRSSAVLGDAPDAFCEFAEPRVTTCRQVAGGGAVLTFPRQSVLAVMERLSIPARDFGPECRPEVTVAITCQHPIRLSERQLTWGPAPIDRPGAEAAIVRAFERSLDAAAGFASVEAGERVAAKVELEREVYDEKVHGVAVAVRRVQFLSETHARVELDVTTGDDRRVPVEGASVLHDGSWFVDRTTFCTIAFVAGLRSCAPLEW